MAVLVKDVPVKVLLLLYITLAGFSLIIKRVTADWWCRRQVAVGGGLRGVYNSQPSPRPPQLCCHHSTVPPQHMVQTITNITCKCLQLLSQTISYQAKTWKHRQHPKLFISVTNLSCRSCNLWTYQYWFSKRPPTVRLQSQIGSGSRSSTSFISLQKTQEPITYKTLSSCSLLKNIATEPAKHVAVGLAI